MSTKTIHEFSGGRGCLTYSLTLKVDGGGGPGPYSQEFSKGIQLGVWNDAIKFELYCHLNYSLFELLVV